MNVFGHEIEWAVYKNKNGKRAVLFASMGREGVSEASVCMRDESELYYISPENIEPERFDGSIQVNPLSVIVVFEK